MTPDYSFDIYVAASAKQHALTLLQRLCTPGSANVLEAAKKNEDDATFALTLSFTTDHALAGWREENPAMHIGVPIDEVHVGEVTAWIKHATDLPGIQEEKFDIVCITLWPVTRSMQIACLESPNVRNALIRLLKDGGGVAGYIDRGDGSLAEFWPQNAAPYGL